MNFDSELIRGFDIPDGVEALFYLDEDGANMVILDNETGELLSIHTLH